LAAAREEATPQVWVERAQGLLGGFFQATDETDTQVLSALTAALTQWVDATETAGCTDTLPLSVFRRAWMGAVEAPRLERRFRAGGVTFCTLMPMRAIPFEVVCLVGMNGADYPRQSPQNGWDLMARPGLARPGDRSRQQDDRQLMLEALLSARRCLHISWAGYSVRDNSVQPPSVLVAQLRDHVAAVWGPGAVDACTTEHPLQPFSRRYFEANSKLSTQTREWWPLHNPSTPSSPHTQEGRWSLEPLDPAIPVDWRRLMGFLKNPVRAFFRERLGVYFDDWREDVPDTELFELDPLTHHRWVQNLLEHWPRPQQAADIQRLLATDVRRLQRAGLFPLGAWGEQVRQVLVTGLKGMAEAWQDLGRQWPDTGAPGPSRFEHHGIQLQGGLGLVCRNGPQQAWLALAAHRVLDSDGRLRPEQLLEPWFRAVVAAVGWGEVDGEGFQGVWVARDAVVRVPPLAREEASGWLCAALDAWRGGMCSPLPLPFKTAWACASGKNSETQRETYEGSAVGRPEAADMYLARCYPDFVGLLADKTPEGGVLFEDLAQRLYSPVLAWAQSQLQVEMYPQP
jgi:exodeoxyribonuclease V gamma subunit